MLCKLKLLSVYHYKIFAKAPARVYGTVCTGHSLHLCDLALVDRAMLEHQVCVASRAVAMLATRVVGFAQTVANAAAYTVLSCVIHRFTSV